MEFWLSDSDCPLPGSGERSLPDTPKKPGDAWQDLNDSWGELLGGPAVTSLRYVILHSRPYLPHTLPLLRCRQASLDLKICQHHLHHLSSSN